MSGMHVWISLAGAPVPVLSTAAQVTGYTLTWLTQLPVIDNMLALFTAGLIILRSHVFETMFLDKI